MKTKQKLYLVGLLTIGLLTTTSCSKDDNCTKQTWYQDSDGDAFGNINQSQQSCSQPVGYVSNNTDCDDTNPNVNPEAVENTSDGIDNNCNGETDECNDDSNCDDGDASTYDICENGICKHYIICTNDSDCPQGMTCGNVGNGIFVCQ